MKSIWKDEINLLQICLPLQSNLFKGAILKSDSAVQANHVVLEILAMMKLKFLPRVAARKLRFLSFFKVLLLLCVCIFFKNNICI